MFEWLEEEISAVRTPRFHVVEGPRGSGEAIGFRLQVPSSYMEFIQKFGGVKLFRNSSNNSYRIGVFGEPRQELLRDGTFVYQIGFHDGAKVYVKAAARAAQCSSIFEVEGEWEEAARTFEQWLAASCALAKSKYSSDKWAEIVRGPKPFTAEEQEIIRARRSIHWKELGIDALGNHAVEVTNKGSRAIPVLTVGARSKDRRLNGAVKLDIRHVGPGQTDVVRVGCYKDLVPASEIELFSLPEPQPEDRELYYEFRRKDVSS